MKEETKLAIGLGLIDETCKLFHKHSKPKADNSLQVPMNDGSFLAIPICRHCVDRLNSEQWTLIYCLNCTQSRWIFRRTAKMRYRHDLLWIRTCPECTGKFSGLYFSNTNGEDD